LRAEKYGNGWIPVGSGVEGENQKRPEQRTNKEKEVWGTPWEELEIGAQRGFLFGPRPLKRKGFPQKCKKKSENKPREENIGKGGGCNFPLLGVLEDQVPRPKMGINVTTEEGKSSEKPSRGVLVAEKVKGFWE